MFIILGGLAWALFNPFGVEGVDFGRAAAHHWALSRREASAGETPADALSLVGGQPTGDQKPGSAAPSGDQSSQITGGSNEPAGVTILDDRPGPGKLVEEGDKVVLQYKVWDGTGRELADSTRRGMPYTMVLGRRNSDKLFSVALAGMHAGGVRTAQIAAGLVPEGIGSIIPPNTDLKIWIFAVAAKVIDPPMSDSSRAAHILQR